MNQPQQYKLELVFPGKRERQRPEPRILIKKEVVKGKKKGIEDNLLIHADNLLGLKALERDYTGKIRCIYIDPPYNTKSCFDYYDDSMEHSLWLNMMRERLVILKKLLQNDGSIWISIDDSECHYLKVLCDEIFGRKNFIANLPTIMNLKGNHDQFGFAGTHEYTLVYSKNKNLLKLNHFPIEEEEMNSDWEEDDFGFFKRADTLRRTGEDAPRKNRPKGWFPVFITSNNQIYVTEDNKPRNQKDLIIWPINTNDEEVSWTWSKEKITNEPHNLIVVQGRNGKNIYKKQRPQLGELPTKKPKSIFYKPEYSSGHGTSHLKKLFGSRTFDYPKSEYLISDFILLATNPGDIVLDCFAGSGTTGAVAHKMKRRWIMIEMGKHAETHVFPRLKKVVNGDDPDGVTAATKWQGGGGFRFCRLAPSLLQKSLLGRPVLNKNYDEEMLREALCKLEDFSFIETSERETWWHHGYSSDRDFIYVTVSTLSRAQLAALSEEVGTSRSLLIFCGAFTCDTSDFENLTVKKIPKAILSKHEWDEDDYSLKPTNKRKTARV